MLHFEIPGALSYMFHSEWALEIEMEMGTVWS